MSFARPPDQQNPDPFWLGWYLFSDEGRIGRYGFWLFCLSALGFAILILLFAGLRQMIVAHTIFGIAMIYPCYCVFAKRLQDMDLPGTLAILMVAVTAVDLVFGLVGMRTRPGWQAKLAYVWMFISNFNLLIVVGMLGIKQGTPGANQYGFEPNI